MCYNLNLNLPLYKSGDEEMNEKIFARTETFFSNGGQELQVAALSTEVLHDAVQNPDKYPDLMVRIAGFNSYFTRLSPVEQQEIIERSKLCQTI